ncbi:hypothetical protein H5P36_04195 [Bacillus sp. APMAM]|nr:hypothetical protein [Bacillus sp. APMAM]
MFHFIGEVTGGIINLEEDEIIDFNWGTIRDLLNFNEDELRNPIAINK